MVLLYDSRQNLALGTAPWFLLGHGCVCSILNAAGWIPGGSLFSLLPNARGTKKTSQNLGLLHRHYNEARYWSQNSPIPMRSSQSWENPEPRPGLGRTQQHISRHLHSDVACQKKTTPHRHRLRHCWHAIWHRWRGSPWTNLDRMPMGKRDT